MFKNLIFLVIFIGGISLVINANKSNPLAFDGISIHWANSIKGDFSFIKNWDYPENVFINQFGQISCDGNCPTEIDRMKNDNGKIYDDSLKAFYAILDTTRQFYSFQSETSTYEWYESNYVSVYRKNTDTTICFSHENIATHSSLILTITKDNCTPIIKLNSISQIGYHLYYCKDGKIAIDKNLWKKGILKACFNFKFHNSDSLGTPMFWKGKIYAKIEPSPPLNPSPLD